MHKRVREHFSREQGRGSKAKLHGVFKDDLGLGAVGTEWCSPATGGTFCRPQQGGVLLFAVHLYFQTLKEF